MSAADTTLNRLRANSWIVPLALGLVVMAAPLWGSATFIRQSLVIAVLALLVSGLNLAWGYGGELAVSQVAMYAAGAYVTGYLAMKGHDMAFSLVVSLLVVTVLGFIVALPSLRLSGWGLAMASFFLVFLIPTFVDMFPTFTGGQTGLLGIPDPILFGQPLGPEAFYVLVIGCAIVWLALMRNLVVGRHGVALQVMRDSPVLAQSLGYGITRLKVTLYVLGAVPAGIAGWLYAYLDRYVSPDYFSFNLVVLFVAASVLGGMRTIYGAVVGVTVIQVVTSEVEVFGRYAFIAFGLLLIVGGIVFGGRFYSRVRHTFQQWIRPAYTARTAGNGDVDLSVAGLTLEVDGIEKSFGAVRALGGVSVTAQAGKITALIGANGSGKTTLLNVISGYYAGDAGHVALDGQVVPVNRPAAAARAGIARTFQTPIMPMSVSVLEAVAAARYRRSYVGTVGAMLRLPAYRRAMTTDIGDARAWIDKVGLGSVANSEADQLPLGSRRLVEVARALTGKPSVLLLDEPASGLESHEVTNLGNLLVSLRDAGATILLVEHNFELITRVADDVYVLDRGELIAHGTVDEIRDNEAVIKSYLGQAGDVREDPKSVLGDAEGVVNPIMEMNV
jgi:branched-chain amino acid transport system permease protein